MVINDDTGRMTNGQRWLEAVTILSQTEIDAPKIGG